MRRVAPDRPFEKGFAPLVQGVRERNFAAYLADFSRLFNEAYNHALFSRTSAICSRIARSKGISDQARYHDNQAQLDHERACRFLYQLATVARDLVQAAALDWMPSYDVVGSGLTEDELHLLCAVFGMPVPAIEEVDREAV